MPRRLRTLQFPDKAGGLPRFRMYRDRMGGGRDANLLVEEQRYVVVGQWYG